MMKTLKKPFYLIFTLSLAFLLSCSSDNDDKGGDNSSKGMLSIDITDAPFPSDLVAEANVTINKVDIRKIGENDSAAFTTLIEEELSFNLLDLTNGVTATLVDLEIEIGAYDLVRLYVTEADVVLSDGSTFDLKVPSGSQTGLKVFIDPAIEVVGGLTSELLLDFDVSRSFVAQGNINSPGGINGFIFKPVVKGANLTNSGRLTGTVTDSVGAVVDGAQVTVYAEDTVNTSSLTDETGSFTVLGLGAGTYWIMVEYGEYEAVTIEEIEIVAGNQTTKDVQLTTQGSSSGRISVEMTDAPFPTDLVLEANVTINKVELKNPIDSLENPFYTLSEEIMSFNLLDLTNGVTATLADIEVPDGTYDQVRLYVEEASVLLVDSTIYDLKIPSGAQTGIKVILDPFVEVVGGEISEVLLDFDVSKSFVVQGNPNSPAGINGFIFKPVIRGVDKQNAGQLAGFVSDTSGVGLEGAQVSLILADTVYSASFTDEDGNYMIMGIPTGTYDVSAELAGYLMATALEVEIEGGEETTQDFELEKE